MNRILSTILLIVIASANAQDLDLEAYKKKYPDDDAVCLKRTQSVSIDIGKSGELEIEKETYSRKVFLNKKARYYIKDEVEFTSFTEITSLEPVVYLYSNGKYKKNKIKDIQELDESDSDVFYDDLKKKVFYYNGLSEGGQTELSYSTKLKEPRFLGGFYFESFFPSELSECVVTTPSSVELGFSLFGADTSIVEYTKSKKGNTITHTWRSKNTDGLDLESRSVPINYYATHLMLHVKSYEYNGKKVNVLNDVNDLNTFYQGFIRDMEASETAELKQLSDSLTSGLETIDEKVKAIFYWVQDHISYVAIEDGLGGFVPRDPMLVWNRRYGDCKDMSSILKELLNYAGIEAHFTWIGTRSKPYTYENLPTPNTDNHMIVSYFDGKEYKVLDATGVGLPYGMPSSFIQGKQALVGVDSTNYKLITVPTVPMETNVTYDSVDVFIEENTVVGNGIVRYSGYPAMFIGSFITSLSADEKERFYESSFKKGNNKCTSKVNNTRNLGNRDSSLFIDYVFSIPDYLRVNGDELYLNPFLKKYQSKEKIDLSTNKLDKTNEYKEMVGNVVVINIPENYEVSFIPEDRSFDHEKFGFDIDFQHNEAERKITLKCILKMNYVVLKAEEFEEWNKFIAELNNAYSELIIFSKKP